MKLSNLLQRSFREHAERPAISVGGERLSYAGLGGRVEAVRRGIVSDGEAGAVGIFADRTLVRYVAVLGIVASGRAYVPLNPAFPGERSARMVALSGCELVLVCAAAVPRFLEVFSGVTPLPEVVILGDTHEGLAELERAGFRARAISLADADGTEPVFREVPGGELAYVLFTSGSTGEPKGIGVTRDNLDAYLRHATAAYGLAPGDRASQMFEYTFDLSVHDFFVTWTAGAELCVPSRMDMFSPASFIGRHSLTHWFSVPSVVAIMKRLGSLGPGVFPSLRQSLFCGEALPAWAASAWQRAAPGSSVHNLYGPTEATIAVTAFRFTDSQEATDSSESVSIGRPFPDHEVRMVDGTAKVVEGEAGEMLVSGPQVTPGYLRRKDLTEKAFVTLPDDASRVWYRTGDLVRRDAEGNLVFLGRVDSQIQLRGHRVELSEIESAVGDLLEPTLPVVVVPLMGDDGLVAGVAALIESADSDRATEIEALVRDKCKARLPDYMIPSKVHLLPAFPLNANGKVDRGALKQFANRPA